MAYQIAVDVGGTFTDGVLLDDATNAIWVAKSLTTPSDPGVAILRVVDLLLEQIGGDAHSIVDRVVHGTTLITNTLLERKGVATALLVTKGTEDTLAIRREMRYDTYDLDATFPEPLILADNVIGVNERLGADGSERRAIDADQLETIAQELAKKDVAAVAICFLHACVDGAHEREVLEAIRRHAPDRSYSISSEVAGEVGEYERMSTVAANAYVQPIVDKYLESLSKRLGQRGIDARLDIMVSHGGFTEAEVAARFPIQLLESGPAGGVLSAINCAEGEKVSHILAFDMGGTTAKSCVAVGGKPEITHIFEFARVRRFRRGSGLPAIAPSIDLIEIGAGGGSIAKLSVLGTLQVGPESASSEPGPACYGLGGEDATVTDADLVLGYLDPDNFLGGKMKLDVDKAKHAMSKIGQSLNLTSEQVAIGIHDIVNENMASAARTHIAERGFDARRFTLVSTGGAGPVHAVDVAHRLRIKRIICPVASGVGSCLGFLAAPARADRSWSRVERIATIDRDELMKRLQQNQATIIDELSKAGIKSDAITWEVSAEIRYLGQGAAVGVKFGGVPFDSLTPDVITSAFEEEYRRLFSRLVPGGIPEIVTWRLTGESGLSQRKYVLTSRGATTLDDALIGVRTIYLPAVKRYESVPVYNRYKLPFGSTLAAPALIVEPESTLVVAHQGTINVCETGTIEVLLSEVA
jgi:N-methylhydantoinase A